jgi:hypothetical protein
VAQVAFSLLLLITAGLFMRALQRLTERRRTLLVTSVPALLQRLLPAPQAYQSRRPSRMP